MKFAPWTGRDYSSERARMWKCKSCGHHSLMSFHLCPLECDCGSEGVLVVGRDYGPLFVWHEEQNL